MKIVKFKDQINDKLRKFDFSVSVERIDSFRFYEGSVGFNIKCESLGSKYAEVVIFKKTNKL